VELVEKFNDLSKLLGNAIADFETSLKADFSKYDAQEIDWIKNAQIQKFEFSVELTWKTAKIYLETIESKIYTPKLVAKALFLHELINEETYIGLMNCIDDRNKLSHIYRFELFDETQANLPNYLITLQEIYTILNKISLSL
jgi:nucleotidyltransferase substrate binding protein (TIGR01987 family)